MSARLKNFVADLKLGYAAAQLGTRFIATTECNASDAYKQAIVNAKESDITLTERLTGVPVSVINNDYVRRLGTKAGPIARWMLKGHKTKHWMRTIYGLNSIWRLKASLKKTNGDGEYWQAGKSVAGIHDVRPTRDIMRDFAAAWRS